jgi:glycosyltransferase involved in cell wall biosynthesis
MLHVTSEQERAESATRLPGVRAAMIPNGVYIPDEIVRTAGNGNIRLAYLGRIDPKKGIENLLAACRILLQQANLRFSLEIAGDGLGSYVSSIRALIENYGLSKQVNMLGNVDGEAKKEFFANADLVMVPSHTENFGLVVAEALAHGVPVIASTGTPWRRLEEVGCGLWVNNDPELLAAAIIQIGGMPLDEMGEKGREWMKREYAWPSLADRMIALYESMLIREMAVSSQRFTQTS